MIFLLVVLAAVAAPVLAAQLPPWWAAPVEHVMTAWGSAFILAMVPTGATIISRAISNRQHHQNQLSIEAATRDTTEIKAAIEVVQREVRTSNGLKLGELAEDGETRRVEKIKPKDRTAAEADHLDVVPPKH